MPCPSGTHRHRPACYTVSITPPKGTHMDIQGIVTQLRQEVSRIEQAIAALVGLGSQPARRGRPPKASPGVATGRKVRTVSASARAKIAAAQRARWAKQKGKAAAKAGPHRKKAAGRKPMSACLLYTSDAADEEDSVDLGGRRII